MIVKGKVFVYWYEDNYSKELSMAVTFKLPNQIFFRTRTETLCSSLWRSDFWAECFEKLNCREYLEDIAKGMIIKYIKEKYKVTEKDMNKKKVLEIIESLNNNFEIEVEYNWTK